MKECSVCGGNADSGCGATVDGKSHYSALDCVERLTKLDIPDLKIERDGARRERDAALLQVGEMQKAIDGIAPYCKVKYGMPEEAVNAIERLEGRVTQKPLSDGLQLGESRNLPYPKPISDDDANKRLCGTPKHMTGEPCELPLPCPNHGGPVQA